MKAASRAPGPRCRRRRGERELHCAAPSGPPPSPSPPRAPRAAQRRPPRPCPRRASLPPSLPLRLARSLARPPAPRLPGPAPSSLRSLQSASRLNLALWAAWSEGSWPGSKMGASARRGRRGARSAGHPYTLAARHPGAGLGRANVVCVCFLPETGPGPRLPSPDQQLVFVLRREPLFCSPSGGTGDPGWPRVFLRLARECPAEPRCTEQTERLFGVGGV